MNKGFMKVRKKAIAVLLSVLVAFCSMISVSGIADGTREGDNSPRVYGAVYDFVKTYAEGSTASNAVQVGPVWYYEYATDTEALTWQLAQRYAWQAWYPHSGLGYYTLGITDKGEMHLLNQKGIAGFSPSLAYKVVSPRDGYIYIKSNDITLRSSTENKYKAQIRITKNGENVYPESGYITIGVEETFKLQNICFDVKKDDEVRFEVKSETPFEAGGEQLTLYWNPTFYLQNDARLYKGEGIFARLTDYMRGVFDTITPATMDNAAESTENKAIEATKASAYGTYSVLDAVYDGDKILTSNDNSVWKFGVEKGFSTELISSEGEFAFTAEKVTEGVKITPENPDNDKIFTVVAVDNNGNSKAYVGIKESLVIPKADISLPFKAQVKYGTKASKILYLTEESGTIKASQKDDKFLLSNHTAKENYIRISSAGVNSYYDVYYSHSELNNQRAIKFTSVKGEKMRFGFTAPHSGLYEIYAPIKAEGDEIYYSVILQGKTHKILTPVTRYKVGDSFCTSQVYINKGETLWFEAYSLGNSVIDIGIPKITYKNTENVSGVTYRYTATDYAENKTANGYSYGNIAATENVKAAWSFGTLDMATETLSPYPFIKDGFYYCNDINSDKSSVGVLYPTFGDNSSDTEKPIYNRNKFYGRVDASTGIYMQFTAPLGANGTLTFTDGISSISGVKVTVKKNSDVYKTYNNGISVGTQLSVGVLNPEDTVTIIIESSDGAPVFGYFGSPVMVLNGYINAVNFKNAQGTNLYNVTAINTSYLTMPEVQKYLGYKFLGWANNKDDVLLGEGDVYKATTGIQFNTDYKYYGDMDENSLIDGEDYNILKNVILEKTADTKEISDIRTDGDINIADLLRLKKLIVNGEYNCN